MRASFKATDLRKELDQTLTHLDTGKNMPCMEIISREMETFWKVVMPKLSSPAKICGKSWDEGQFAYKCRTCEKDPTCVLCIDCFKVDKHAGHDYKIIRTYGGMCDCGDVESWDSQGFCDEHPGRCQTEKDELDIPADMLEWLQELIGFCITAVWKGTYALQCSSEHSLLFATIKKMLQGLNLIVKSGDVGRSMVARICCKGADAILDKMFLHEITVREKPWDSAFAAFIELTQSLIPDPVFKLEFAKALLHNYVQICSNHDARTTAKPEKSLRDFSVQVFTVSNICKELIDPVHFGAGSTHMLHYVLIAGLNNAYCYQESVEKSHAKQKSADDRAEETRLAFYTEMLFTDLSYILSSDVAVMKAFLEDHFLVHVFCMILSIVHRFVSLLQGEQSSHFRFDVITAIDGAVEKVFKIIIRSVPELLSQEFHWHKDTKMLQLSQPLDEVQERSFLQEARGNFGSRAFENVISSRQRDFCERTGFQLILDWLMRYILFHADAVKISPKDEPDGSPNIKGSDFPYILPFHRLFARLTTAIVRCCHIEDISSLFPQDMPLNILEKTLDGPVLLQALRAYLYTQQNSTNRILSLLSSLAEYYESSTQLEHDVTYLQIIVCMTGPAALSHSVRRAFGASSGLPVGMSIIFHLFISTALRRDKTPRERYEQSVINILAVKPQRYSEFLRNYEKRYALFLDDDNEGDEYSGISKDQIFSSLTKRTNSTNPAIYALKAEYLQRSSIYDADSTFQDILRVTQIKQGGSVLPSFIPEAPANGPYAAAILLLHTEFTVLLARHCIIMAFQNGVPNPYILRTALDYCICSLRTYAQRGDLWKADIAKGLESKLYDPSTFADMDMDSSGNDMKAHVMKRSFYGLMDFMQEREHTDIFWVMEQPTGRYKEGRCLVLLLKEMRTREEFADYHQHIAALLDHLRPRDEAMGTEGTSPKEEQKTGIDSAKLEKKRNKALEKLKKQQLSFEKDKNLNLGSTKCGKEDLDGTSALTLATEMSSFYNQMVCVSCHEHTNDAGGLGMITHAMHSNVLHTIHGDRAYGQQAQSEVPSLQAPQSSSLHITTCGHAIHEDCLQKLMNHNHSSQAFYDGHKGSDLLLPHEFLCPACSRLSSGILNTHHHKGMVQSFLDCNLALSMPENEEVVFHTSIEPLSLSGIEVSRSQSTLFWIHTRKIAVADFEEEDLEILSGNHFESALSAFGMQVVLLEIQSRFDTSLVTIRKIAMLHTLLHNLINSIRSYAPESEEHKANAKIQDCLADLFAGKTSNSIANFDPFTLLLQSTIRLVLSGRNREKLYQQIRTRIFGLAWQRYMNFEYLKVLARQSAVLHMIVCPHRMQWQDTLQKSFSQLIDSSMSEAHENMASFGPAHTISSTSHELPLLTENIVLPYLSRCQDNFLDLMIDRHGQECTRCKVKARQQLICLSCGSIVCFLSQCCPSECTQHAFECGKGSCFYLNISHSASGIFFVNAHTNQCALLKSPWLDAHGEQDVGCHRGRPLTKDNETIRMINKYWLEGSVFQDTGILVEKAWLFTSDEL